MLRKKWVKLFVNAKSKNLMDVEEKVEKMVRTQNLASKL